MLPQRLNTNQRLAIPLPGNAITEVMKFYANSGDMEGVERVMSTYLTGTRFLTRDRARW